ncbi:patatin-like phospholipase family protein [Mycobacterium spongiae]|uniref:Phospholipase n=1 Tax=Mycobacterium spongiae TaxID=886343 RepID=A0A975PVQ5_9MYCO|nr:patatin-like phospholipase family protein [Mycobacterium spongiae]QUR66355.1 phospholipase [Mycobacterium spongiae]
MEAPRQRADLVLSGGGVKFMGLVGAIAGLLDAGYTTYRVSGVSAGSVVAVISAAASKADQLASDQIRELALSVPLSKWRDAGPVPLLGSALGLMRDSAMYRGDAAYDWIRGELKNLGVTTFGELALDDDQLPVEQRYRVAVTVADLTRAQLVRLPWDYRRVYGVDPDEQPVAMAVRASMAIPFIYPPVTVTGMDGLRSTLVDGGVLSSFPIDSLDRIDRIPPRWPTFGITVIPKLAEGVEQAFPALRPLRFLQQSALLESLFTTMLVGHDQAHLSQPWVSARTIPVASTDVGVLDFDIATSRLEELYDRGYAATEAFLSSWDWPQYLQRFRQFPE